MRGVVVSAVALLFAACAAPGQQPSPSGLPKPPAELRVPAAPDWRPGDRWVYRWQSGEQTDTRTVEVLEIREMGGVRYYVARSEDVHEYWTTDLHWAALVRDTRVEARALPPEPWFVWPLEVGRRWSHDGVYENRDGRKESKQEFLVEASETVEVPAGRFEALRLVRESSTLQFDRYWFAPDVRSYVKWSGRRGETEFTVELMEYREGPRAIPGSVRDEPARR
jgi:hypothetical protein